MKNGLRLDFVEKMGLTHLVKGDTIWHDSFGELVVRYDIETKPISQGTEVTFFADRKNTGEQPVPDDFPVVVAHRDSHFAERRLADDVSWDFSFTWKPDYDKLLEMQTLHDRDQPKSVTIELREYQLPKAKEVEVPSHELKSNVEYYSPVTGYKYKFFNYDLHFLGNNNAWDISGVGNINSLQLRERVKPVVVGYNVILNNNEKGNSFTKKNLASSFDVLNSRPTLKRINGKPLFRPVYKKD